jgi:hypothetical protein
MFPSNLSRRAAIMSSLATGTLALALTAAPAQAAPQLVAGAPCPSALTPQSVLQALNLKCVAGTLTALVPAPPSALPTLPLPAVPSAAPSSTAPNPLSSLAAGVTSTVTGLASTAAGVTGPVSDAVNGAVSSLLNGVPSTSPTTPGTPGTTGGLPGTTTGTSTGSNGGTAKPGSPLTGASKAPSTKDGSSLLGPAAAFLPGASLANFADLSSGSGALLPLADNIPSPLIASAEGKLAAVQAPLIAAGQAAASQADSGLFSRFGGKALPGLLVVIGTALVAAVGAGNLRAWQTRFGGVNMRAWKRSAK